LLQGLAIAVGALLAISKIPAISIVVVAKAIAIRDFVSFSMFDFLLIPILAIVIYYLLVMIYFHCVCYYKIVILVFYCGFITKK
jgi:hypothetical protein